MILDPDIRVLTVLEPWATCIADGRKPVENRPPRVAQFVKPGSVFVVHAGGSMTRWPDIDEMTAPDARCWPTEFQHGHAVAVVEVEIVEPPGEPPRGRHPVWRNWTEAGIYFRRVHRLTPVPLKGGQGWRRLLKADQKAFYAIAEQMYDVWGDR